MKTKTPLLLRLITLGLFSNPLYLYAKKAPTTAIAISIVIYIPLAISLAKLKVTARKITVALYYANAALSILALASPAITPSFSASAAVVSLAFALYLQSTNIRDLFQAHQDPYKPKRRQPQDP
jgi:hypothetical protein